MVQNIEIKHFQQNKNADLFEPLNLRSLNSNVLTFVLNLDFNRSCDFLRFVRSSFLALTHNFEKLSWVR